jgi:transcriptional regulator with XRE-family HTH domain
VVTHLWALIEDWRKAQLFPVSQAALAAAVGVQRSAVSQWKSGQARPTPEHLRKIHRVTHIEYPRLVEAMVRDMGYLNGEEVDGDGNTAPTSGGLAD